MTDKEHSIEKMRLQRMIADRNDFITSKVLWHEFCDWRPNDEKKEVKKRDAVDHMLSLFRASWRWG